MSDEGLYDWMNETKEVKPKPKPKTKKKALDAKPRTYVVAIDPAISVEKEKLELKISWLLDDFDVIKGYLRKPTVKYTRNSQVRNVANFEKHLKELIK